MKKLLDPCWQAVLLKYSHYYYSHVLYDVIATIATFFMLIYIQIIENAVENVMKRVLDTKLFMCFSSFVLYIERKDTIYIINCLHL